MSRLTRDGTAEPDSRDQILRRERGQGNINFACSTDHEQDCPPYPVDPYYSAICDDYIVGCQDKTSRSSWHLIGFPDGSSIGLIDSIMSGRNPPLYCTLALIAMQGHQNRDKRHDNSRYDSFFLSWI